MIVSNPLDLDEAVRRAHVHVAFGAVRLPAVARELAPSGLVRLATFEVADLDDFTNTAVLENDSTRLLTATLSARTLRRLAERIQADYGGFAGLAGSVRQAGLDPTWFASCARIEEEGFDWVRYLPPWLVPAMGTETRGDPAPTRYIWEGTHSSLVLAHGLVTGRIAPRAIDVVECLQRPTG